MLACLEFLGGGGYIFPFICLFQRCTYLLFVSTRFLHTLFFVAVIGLIIYMFKSSFYSALFYPLFQLSSILSFRHSHSIFLNVFFLIFPFCISNVLRGKVVTPGALNPLVFVRSMVSCSLHSVISPLYWKQGYDHRASQDKHVISLFLLLNWSIPGQTYRRSRKLTSSPLIVLTFGIHNG